MPRQWLSIACNVTLRSKAVKFPAQISVLAAYDASPASRICSSQFVFGQMRFLFQHLYQRHIPAAIPLQRRFSPGISTALQSTPRHMHVKQFGEHAVTPKT